MVAKINADTSGGLKITSDTSGTLEIQSAGTTKFTVNSAGVAMPGPLTGLTSINGGQVGGSRNKIINGAMEINQRGTAAVATDQAFPSDRYKTAEAGGGNMTCQVVADAPASFRNSIKVIASTADDCSQAADEYRIYQRIEGNNVVDLYYGASGAKTTTLSFWVKSSLTGNFPVGLENSASNRSLVKQYNIAQADTWEKKSVTFVGDETGTWLITNGIGLGVSFVLGAGSNYTNTIDAWQAARVYRGSSSVQMMATVNATWFVTGVQLEIGSTATDFEYKTFAEELALCQRYYEQSYNYGVAVGTTTYDGGSFEGGSATTRTTGYIAGSSIDFRVEKRGDPTIIAYDQAGASGKSQRYELGVSNTNNSAIAIGHTDLRNFMCYSNTGSNATGLFLHFTATAEL